MTQQLYMHAERVKCTARQTDLIQYGDENVDLSAVEQLVEKSQTRAIADALNLLRLWLNQQQHQGKTIAELLQHLEQELDSKVGLWPTLSQHSACAEIESILQQSVRQQANLLLHHS